MLEMACDLNLLQQTLVGPISWNSSEPEPENLSGCSLNFIQSSFNGLYIYLVLVILIYRNFCLKSSRTVHQNRGRIVKVESREEHEEQKLTSTLDNVNSESKTQFWKGRRNQGEKNIGDNEETVGAEDEGDKSEPEFVHANASGGNDGNGRMFCHHVSVWNLTLIFILGCCAELAESIILFLAQSVGAGNGVASGDENILMNGNNTYDGILNVDSENDNYNYYKLIFSYLRLLTPAITFIAASLALLFYRHVEFNQKAKYLVVNICFFVITSMLCWTKLYIHYYATGLSLRHVKVIVDLTTWISSAALTAFLIRILFVHRRNSWTAYNHQENVNLSNVKYLHYHSTLLSRISFYWFTALLRLGYKQPLEDQDLGELPPEEKTIYQFERLNDIFKAEREKSPNDRINLWKCFFKGLWASMFVGGVFRLAADFAGFVAPLGIKTIVSYTSNNMTLSELHGTADHLEITELLANGYVMAIIILLSSLLQSTFSQCSTFLVNSEGIHVKIALQAMIYKKSLTLSPTKGPQPEHHANANPSSGEDDEGDDNKSSCNSSVQSSASPRFDNGSIANVMSADTNNIMMFFWMAHFIWAIPLKLAILMVLLYFQLGYSALIGAGICIFIMIPLQFLIGKNMSANSKELMERCDERLRAISEILQGMKLLKLHGWELIFSQQVSTIRKKELKNLDRDLLYRSMMTFLTHISSVLVTVVTFGLYPIIEEDRLEPSKVFAGLALFNQLTVPLFIFPITVPVVIDALVSTRRVREFLSLPEAASLPTGEGSSSPDSVDKENKARTDSAPRRKDAPTTVNVLSPQSRDLQASSDSVFILGNIAEDEEEEKDGVFDSEEKGQVVETPNANNTLSGEASVNINDIAPPPPTPSVLTVKNGYFSWEESGGIYEDNLQQSNLQAQHGLLDISVKIPKEKLTVIVGPIGSGKSSLVSALLGEMRKVSGEMTWTRGSTIAYATQKPWMLNASVRENILFGKQFKPGRYEKVIGACSLKSDIDTLPEKDGTEIGEKGINLSGGQKQRIAIARAFYSNASVVILDDPLSALDIEVASDVLDSGIRKFLLRSRRSVILVTHHLPVVEHAHHIIAMDKGRIRQQGTLTDIQARDSALYLEWQDMITKTKVEMEKRKTAKDRWSLLKLVSKIGLQFKQKPPDETWKPDEKNKPPLDFYQKRKQTFSHYKNLSHDIFLPSDECHDEILMTPLRRRRPVSRASRESRTSASSNKHVELHRMTSLQPESSTKGRSPMSAKNMKRLQSLPADDDVQLSSSPPLSQIRPRSTTYDNAQRVPENIFKKLFSSRKTISSTGSSNPELEKVAISTPERLVTNVSGASESDAFEEDIDAGQSLLAHEPSQDEREYGTIPMRVYMSYISSCGQFLSALYLFFAIGYEVVRVYTNFWLSAWSDNVSHSTEATYDDIMSHYFHIYVLLSLVTVAVSLFCNLVGKQAGANSREILHSRMMDRVVRCPVRFFDSTPIGGIINRFSSDVAVVDRKLCISMQRFLQFVFLCVSAIVVNAIVNPWFLLVALPVVAIYYYIQRFYRFSSRELQRIQAISRGPIYSHFHETLEGLSTIRAYREQKRFTNQMLMKIDANNRADMFINIGNRWLSISLDYLGSVIVFLATLASTISSYLYPDVVTPSMVGLAINYTLLVPVYLNWVVKFLAEVEMFMNSVERMDRYAQLDIEDYEGDLSSASSQLPEKWPSKGNVVFENVSVQYGPDRPKIISGLKLHIPSQQKTGICGRSGCGKSSLLMALFRISDISDGRIIIDGVDIATMPLLKLRSSLSIIPQENILFSGTLRFNLDPHNKISDDEMWRALESCQMNEIVREMPGQLDADIKNGGASFSAGQKQLLALARAILHKSKLVIMDEATSSVDIATERILLKVVKDVFKDSTVLTIAHRLDTIVEGTRVLVLEGGTVIEDGNPAKLMKNPKSHFARMLKSAEEQSKFGH